ncbi:unnamed protein product [[Actinomadura] parvosata subsp. kistnae]|nr:unnamed protein product [Actinomadura parvosata subsp. kistnae]
MVQEALTNAVRHAADRGAGLRDMRERVRLLGGALSAGPAGPGGWRVRADLPREGNAW